MTTDIIGPKINEDIFLKQVEEYQKYYVPRCECGTILDCPGMTARNHAPSRLNYLCNDDFKLIVAGSRTIDRVFIPL